MLRRVELTCFQRGGRFGQVFNLHAEGLSPVREDVLMSSVLGKALLADNQPLFRHAMATLLHDRFGIEVPINVGDWREMLLALRAGAPISLAIIDLELTGMLRLEGIKHLRVSMPRMLVLVVSAVRERRAALDVLAAGAHGYLTRDSDFRVVETAIGTILAGNLYVPALVATGEDGRRGAKDEPAHHLTERQREVLDLVVAGQSNKQISRTLHIAEGTVKVHVTAGFRQLGVHSRAGAAHALHSCAAASPEAKWFDEAIIADRGKSNGAAR